ncbi:MAG: ABC transporter ATP-binding protein [Termitinemataceae bacterium]|nr:MAG: ABC transporter ATP-binding protein [Termitinemataceae bacterium]
MKGGNLKKTVLKTKDLSVGYNKKSIIENINITAVQGSIICLLGPNGAGKTTILRTLSSLLSPVAGAVFLDGQNIINIKAQEKAQKLAVVLTEKINMPLTTAYDIVCMGRTPYTGFFGRLSENDHAIVKECMQLTGSESLANRIFLDLSDGEKQKVMIARALAQEPELIILDEPTSHLDLKHKVEVAGILNKLSRKSGLTVILSLHDIDIAIKSCEYLILVKDGKIADFGKSEDIINIDTINNLYNIEGAAFNFVLGNVEIHNTKPATIFVVAGAATGTPVYRTLSRLGIGIATGVLHKNDVDYFTASSMNLQTIIAENSFCPVRDSLYDAACNSMQNTKLIIDAGFPVGDANKKNIELLQEASKKYHVLSMRPQQEIEHIYKENAVNITTFSSYSELAKLVGADI